MKKIILLLAFAFISLFAAELRVATDYKNAIDIAKKENKNIVLMLTQYGCPACKYMANVTMKNEDVKEALSGYVFVDVDIYEGSWNKKYRAFGTPTIYLLDKNENKIKHFIGAMEPAEFIKVIKQLEGTKK